MTKPIVTHESAAERFFAKVDKTASHGCWLWTACCFDNGYGAFRFNQKQVKAHRFSYELINGPLSDELRACHRCDELYPRKDLTYKRCVNPEHLFAGTQSDNIRDCFNKGRQRERRGIISNFAKLTEDEVRQVRTIYARGDISQQDVGILFGLTQTAVSLIIRRVNWKHIT